MSNKAALSAWTCRNKESLSAEYRDYALRHDYDIDGPMPFQTWVEREYRSHLENSRASLADKHEGRCRCFDDSGSCDWCLIYYGHVDPEEVSA